MGNDTMKLGLGPYGSAHDSEGENAATKHARSLFFEAIKDIEPKVLEQLRDDVMPVYEQALRYIHVYKLPPERTHIKVLRDWGKHWNLDEEWVYDFAKDIMRNWVIGPESAAALDLPILIVPLGGLETLNEERELRESLINDLRARRLWFDSHRLTSNEWLDQLKQAIDDFKPKAEAYLAEHGVESAPGNRKPEQHLAWLVMYQVKDLNQNAIAEQMHKSRQTVKEGIDSAAKLVGIEPRKRKRRAPKKS